MRISTLSTGPAPNAVTLRGVSKSFGAHAVLTDVSLDIAKGEFLAIVGPSGSGKTTLMRLIGGFESPDSGSIAIGGVDVTHLPPARRKVNTVFQNYALFPHLNVLDNVAYGPRMSGVGRKARTEKAQRLLDIVHLPHAGQQKPSQLSGGMQQRVALARALANDPEVLLLDEPLGALDRKLRDEMQRELRRIQAELAATFLYVTHDQAEAFGMADRLAVMRAGRIEQIGAPADIYDRPANAWVALFVGSANTLEARVQRTGPTAQLSSDHGPLAAGYLAKGLGVGDRALVTIRPEATSFAPRSAGITRPAQNQIEARLVESAVLGASLRLRAVTASGVAFESIKHRAAESPGAALGVGDAITVTFDPAAARAYRPDDHAGAPDSLARSEKE